MSIEGHTAVIDAPAIPAYQKAIRYWIIGKKGELKPPISAGSFEWKLGVNNGYPYGLYGFHYDQVVAGSCYFDFSTGTFAGELCEDRAIGSIAYWGNPNQAVAGQMVAARFASVTCLLEYPGMSKVHCKRIRRAADRYQVEVVDIDKIAATTERYVREVLPRFDLSELVAKIK